MNTPVDLGSVRVIVVCFPTSEVTPPIHCPELATSVKVNYKIKYILNNTYTSEHLA